MEYTLNGSGPRNTRNRQTKLFNMSVQMILTICILALIPTGGLSCGGGGGGKGGGKGGGGRGWGNSPSGGSTCNFYRSSLRLECYNDRRTVTCEAVKTSVSSENSKGGPTPYGEYLIGQHRLSTSYSGLDWFNLYPKKEDNSGYYGYNSPNKKGRYEMGLHPGRVSEGCVTVDTYSCNYGDYHCYNSNSCWKKIKSVITSGSMRYRGSSYSGILYVK